MKKNSPKLKSNQPVLFVYLFVLVLITCSCAKKSAFLVSSIQPELKGYTEVKKDKNSNYRVLIELTKLSESTRLLPSKRVYIVWMVSDGDVKRNIGQIKPNSNLNASFETVSSIKPKKIFITAEDDASLQIPGRAIILTTNKF